MLIETTRFGQVEIDAERILTFAGGMLGFPDRQRFALIETDASAAFYWLQCVDDAGLAFLVCDPRSFIPEYSATIRADDVRTLELPDLNDAQVFVIVNKVNGHLTANLLGPLVIGATSRKGKQLVLSERKYSTRQVLVPVRPHAAIAKTA